MVSSRPRNPSQWTTMSSPRAVSVRSRGRLQGTAPEFDAVGTVAMEDSQLPNLRTTRLSRARWAAKCGHISLEGTRPVGADSHLISLAIRQALAGQSYTHLRAHETDSY